MIVRRYRDLVMCRTSVATEPFGMVAPGRLDSENASMGNDVGQRGAKRLSDHVSDLVADATTLAAALDFDGIVRDGPYVSFLPAAAGQMPHATCMWIGTGGTSWIASTAPIPSIASVDATFASWSGSRAVEIDTPPPGWTTFEG